MHKMKQSQNLENSAEDPYTTEITYVLLTEGQAS